MPDLSIDRLALRVPGLASRDAERLAQLIGDGLAAVAPSRGAGAPIDELDVSVEAQPGEPLERLADRIVAQISRKLGASG